MTHDIHVNRHAHHTADDVDRINNDFYSRFNYPWVPMALPAYPGGPFWTRALSQDLGFWHHERLPEAPEIWVAGCGTNQAVLTALKFPQARVVGSDVSTRSLETCARIADQLGINNLTLREESLNHVDYDQAFDYVLCTGVIHHNADPGRPLNGLKRALKPGGVLELMVYNYYHRIQTTAFQKAIRLLGGQGDRPNIDTELPLTLAMIEQYPAEGDMAEFLARQRSLPEAAVADSLLQPVEYSYTVHSLQDALNSAGLQLATYCLNQFDQASGQTDWWMPFSTQDQRNAYEALSDLDRWQVTNLLLGERSPMLWFYVQRDDSPFPVLTDAALAQGFLEQTFEPAKTSVRQFVLKEAGRYEALPRDLSCPAPATPMDPVARQVFAQCDGRRRMAEILTDLGLGGETAAVNRLRLALTSSAQPYLRAV